MRHLSRIIPAHAGQIDQKGKVKWTVEDHPRTRGTNRCYRMIDIENEGSSPHTRDKLQNTKKFILVTRIIPAHAGQISLLYPHRRLLRDHPRTRGTNCF